MAKLLYTHKVDSSHQPTGLWAGGSGYHCTMTSQMFDCSGAVWSTRWARIQVRLMDKVPRADGGVEGTLQLNVEGRGWGFVCDDDFGTHDATAACRDMGYDYGTAITGLSLPATPDFVADDVACAVNSGGVNSCSMHFNNNCNRGEGSGVSCSVSSAPYCTRPSTTTGYVLGAALDSTSVPTSVTCAEGYVGTASTVPCGTPNNPYGLQGCTAAAECVRPPYDAQGIAVSTAYSIESETLSIPTFHVDSSCAPGFAGTVAATACVSNEDEYHIGGCESICTNGDVLGCDDSFACMAAAAQPNEYDMFSRVINDNLHSWEPVRDGWDSGYIGDGGEDMYDRGNLIMTSLCQTGYHLQPYTTGMDLVSSDCFGVDGGYRMDMQGSMMLLLSHNSGVEPLTFIIAGNLGADGGGSLSTRRFTHATHWTGFGKSVCQVSAAHVARALRMLYAAVSPSQFFRDHGALSILCAPFFRPKATQASIICSSWTLCTRQMRHTPRASARTTMATRSATLARTP
eukprot:SAG22_NODE_37_length_26837_cov_8.103523_2_plen_514_part_00